MKGFEIEELTEIDAVNLALDTIKIGKQAIIFASTKESAEKTAEEISKGIKGSSERLENLSLEILQSLSKPTRQCERLAKCIKKGSAFHHAGLTHSQRQLIEDAFRVHEIKIICSTPTLAAGIDMPAFRTIIKDLKRFGKRGMQYIPVLEYLQMAGRAGRPKFDKEGEAIAIAHSKKEAKFIYNNYVRGFPEEIYSKLGVEPVLRTYLLSLIASGLVATKSGMINFFRKSFYAHQFRDFKELDMMIEKTLKLLESWGFVHEQEDDFVAADSILNEEIKATALGKRIAELYIDPLTAHEFILGLKKSDARKISGFSFLQLISSTIEMRPLLRIRISEFEDVNNRLLEHHEYLLMDEPSMYDEDYDYFMNSVKTALFFDDWIEESDEGFLLEKYRIRPGEIRAKIEAADWLLYSMQELARMMRMQILLKEITKLRIRIKYGVKEELLPLLKLKNIGRVRARKLYAHNIRDIGDVKKAELRKLAEILGSSIASDVKKQVGEKLPEELKVKEGKRKGQISLEDYEE